MDVAIVGIGCRFPGDADTPADFWQLLCDGVDAITELPAERFDIDEVYDPDPAAPGKIYSRWGGFVADVDRFDADFFGIAPREAKQMDPQHRLLLEVAWEALEDGGQVPERLAGTSTGVYVGVSTHDYGDMHMGPGQRHLLDPHVNIGNALCAAPNRLSYLLDLRGPSMAIETACSSSLTAVHLACRSLEAGDCTLAIAGGVNLMLAPELTIGFCKASMISPDGRCRAFDASANGYVRSEGAGVVVLKPLAAAVAARDPIYAVVRGTAVNEDGRTAGISLPSPDAQEALLRQALCAADVEPAAIQYIEAHGTGTAAGDPIEAAAIGRVFGTGRDGGNALLIGSAKTNVGHLEAGAGITGLIKTALMLRHRQVPATLHFEEPNPDIPFDELHLRVPTVLEPWPTTTGPALAGVNAFGFGGANAHAILAEPPAVPPAPEGPAISTHVLTVSARSPDALRAAASRFRDRLRSDAPDLQDLCHTAAVRRSHHPHRVAVVGNTADALADHLGTFLAGEATPSVAAGRAGQGEQPKLAFVFAGMGPQWWAMGRQLLTEAPHFAEVLEDCDRLLRPLSGWSLLDELLADEAGSRVDETRIVQVTNCALQIALAALWRSWGVVPDAVIGHSAGEMAAAHVAGALERHEALLVAFHRGRLLHRATGTGTMLAAAISAEEAAAIVDAGGARVALAAVNSPSSITLSGHVEALGSIARDLEERDRFCRMLPTRVPYHGPQMDFARDELLDALGDLDPRPASIPFVSTVTGTWIGEARLDGEYWWRNIRQTVRFADGVDTLVDAGHTLYAEIAPHPAMSTYLSETAAERDATATTVPSLRRGEDERETMLRSLAALHVRGRTIDWAGVYPEGNHVPLPGYPWQREHFWLDDPTPLAARAGVDTGHPLLGRRLPSPQPTWETSLDDPRLDYLDAHVVEDSAVFPGAGYLEMALAAARQLHDDTPTTLERVEFEKLLFPGASRELVLQLNHDPRTARFEIHSATHGDTADWTRHATATLRSTGPADVASTMDLAEARERCSEELAVVDHYQRLTEHGFRYGGPFRGLEQVWAGDAEALARVGFPADLTLPVDAYLVHPALLDACFQVLVAAASAGRETATPTAPLFPVALRRVVFHRHPGERFWTHVTVQRADDGILEGDVSLLDDDGRVAIACFGLRLKMLDAGRAGQHDDLEDSLYELRWEDTPLDGTARTAAQVHPAAEVRDALEARPGPEDEPEMDQYHDDVAPALGRVSIGFALAALEELGFDGERDRDAPTDALADRLGVVSGRRRLFGALLPAVRRALADGTAPPARDVAALRDDLDVLAARLPAFAAEVGLLRLGGSALGGVLRGEVDAREVLLSGQALELQSRMYHASPACRGYHRLLADAVAAAVDGGDDTTAVRVLEVGAGSGAATASILPKLPPATEYTFTDISAHFVAAAGERFGDRPGTRFEVLDLERDPEAQGFDPQAYDVVVAANVLHATADLRTSLGHLQRLLAPGGLVAVLELRRRSYWYNLVFGLLDGWWRFTDTEVRADDPLLDAAPWRSLFEDTGYEQATTPFGHARGGGGLQTLVLAQAPAITPSAVVVSPPPTGTSETRRWLLLADEGGAGEQLATTLRREGDACTLATPGVAYQRRTDEAVEVPPADAPALERLLTDLQATDQAPDGIVHLWSLDIGDQGSAGELMDAQQLGCESVLALAQALERVGGEAPAIWMVTAGAQPVDGHDAAPNVGQAPLWGIGRVLMNEQGNLRCRLVDLGPQRSPEDLGALAANLRAGRADDELALRGPRRYVRRVRRTQLGEPAARQRRTSRSPDTDAFRLEIDAPGSLASLTLREGEHREPGPGEVAIRVRASGINFRDVLMGLGMLPDAELAAYPEPGALGIECSGVVVDCGEGVTDLHPGAEVVALAWGAHGSRVVTPASRVAPKPPGLTFAEAASVPTAFVTVEYALGHVARLAPGERVLVHGAAGAVGHAAIQFCQRVGAEVFATAGTPEKRDHLQALGVEQVSDSRSLAFVDDIRRATGDDGVDVVLNSLTAEAMRASLELLRPHGRFIELGKRDIYEDAQLGLLPFQNNLVYTAVDLIGYAIDRPAEAKRLLLDVIDRVAAGHAVPLPVTTFDLGAAEDAFRLIAQARHIGKVVLTVDEPAYDVGERDEPLCSGDGTYLVTGGLGGFGMAVAQWLVEQGARTIVLMSRSGIPMGDPAALDALLDSPARVIVERGDVGETDDVARVLDRVRAELPPLRGVVHAAMVVDDDELVRLGSERFRSVLKPKIAGAWNLHQLTAGDDLDLFVLFSSIASVLGHPLQGNYAAANAFLDALAAHRHGRGLPALAVGWGAVADVGYVARHRDIGDYLHRGGFRTYTPAEAFHLLEALLRRDRAHVIAARMHWPAVMAANPVLASTPRFEALASAGARPDRGRDGGHPDTREAILHAAPTERRPLLEAYLLDNVARVLGSTPERIDPDRPLTELGFDSLMAVELISAIKADFEVRLPVVGVLQGASARQLAGTVLAELAGSDGSSELEEPTGTANDSRAAEPLSHEQRRLWYLQRLDPEDPTYNVPSAVALSGQLDIAAMERSLTTVVERHEILRAVLQEVDDEPVQLFAAPQPVSLPVEDLRDVPEADRDLELRRRTAAEIGRPFDLAHGPLLRAALFRLADTEHVLLLVVHHLACDHWSLGVLAREIAALYDTYAAGRVPTLPAPRRRYVDYVHRERERLTGDLVATQLDYWTDQLADAPGGLPLPDRRQTDPEAGGGHRRFELGAELTTALERSSRDEGVTPFMTLLAAFQTLLHRYTGATDLCIGTPVATRTPEEDAVVGCFMNTLVLRGDLAGDPTFRELLGRARQVTVDAFEHRDVPIDRVVEAVRPQRSTGRTPLFEAMLVLNSARFPQPSFVDLDVHPVDVGGGAAVADLALVLFAGDSIGGVLQYDAGRFDGDFIDQLLRHLRNLLEGATGDPDQRLSELPLLSRAERHRVLVEWNDTAVCLGAPRCLHDLVADQARRTPHAQAVASATGSLTYEELNRRADVLARRLRRLGVGPERVVGALVERSPEAIIAILGVLKAGGAYLPLDPTHPAGRLRFQIDDAEVAVVLTFDRLRDRLPELAVPLVVTDGDAEREGADELPPATRHTPDDLAYVLYTSGSSGRPKAVAVPHRAVVNHLRWRQHAFPLDESDAVLQRTPLTFDPSVWEVFGPLTAGARLVLPRPGADADGSHLATLMASQNVTVFQAVPSILEALLDEPEIAECRALRRVFCGGEPLRADLVQRFSARLTAELHQVYGPTEATIEATHGRCEGDTNSASVPIGRPIANVTVHLLDAHRQPVPVGAIGEVHIGGAGLARGYLNRPELTREHFIANPLDEVPGERLYRTGDLARWLPDGRIEFVGRRDEQVKIRGFRVEPAEIEAVLAVHPGVREIAVVPTPNGSGDRRLVAAVVPGDDASPDQADLQRFAAEQLPDFMVPAAVTRCAELPRTASGKVDRARLISKVRTPERTTEAVAPRDTIERQLQQLWQSLLPDRPVGVADDFFDLGGHSLLAMRLVARINRVLGVELPVSSLLSERTIERLAGLLRDPANTRSPLVALQTQGDDPPWFFVHPAGGTVFCYVELARALGAARPVYGLEAVGLREGEEAHRRIEHMASSYLDAIREVQPTGPYLLGGWSLGGTIAFEMARQLEANDEPIDVLAVLDTPPPAPGGGDGDQAEAALLRGFAESLGLHPEAFRGSLQELRALDGDAQEAYLLERARSAGLVLADAGLEGLRRQARVFAATVSARDAFVPQPFPGRVALIEAGPSSDGHAGWETLALGEVLHRTTSGDHYSMLRRPHVAAVAAHLQALLADPEPVAS